MGRWTSEDAPGQLTLTRPNVVLFSLGLRRPSSENVKRVVWRFLWTYVLTVLVFAFGFVCASERPGAARD